MLRLASVATLNNREVTIMITIAGNLPGDNDIVYRMYDKRKKDYWDSPTAYSWAVKATAMRTCRRAHRKMSTTNFRKRFAVHKFHSVTVLLQQK